MKKYISAFFKPAFALLVLATSCIEKELDFDGIKTQDWNSEWALPLIDSKLGIDDLLNDSIENILEDDEGLISLVYESQQLVSVMASEIAEIPNQEKEISESFDLPEIPAGISGSVPVQFKFTFELDEENLRIDSILLKKGNYLFSVQTNLDKDVTGIDFEVPNLIDISTGIPLQFTLDIDPQGGIIEKDTVFDLSSYKIVFENTFADTNQIYIHGLVHFVSDGTPPNNPYFLMLHNDFQQMEFHKFFGYGGLRSISMTDTIKLNIFDVNQEGNFTFGDGSVILNFDVKNSFGLPVLLDIKQFTAYHGENDQDSIQIHIFGDGIPPEIELDYPSLDEVGQTVVTEVNTSNSNMNEALEISPNRIFVFIEGLLNPDEDITASNFIIDTSNISVDLDLEVKLFGGVSNFTITDTLDFDLGNIDEIESLTFATEIINGFPINASVQLNFVDSLYQVTHELLSGEERLMVAGTVGNGPDYKVVSPSSKTTIIPLAPDEVQKVLDSRMILINAVLSTDDGALVKIYSDYELHVKMGAKAGIKL